MEDNNLQDMNYYEIDFINIKNSEDLHKCFAKALSFSKYYGDNYDALFDMLTEIAKPTHIKIINFKYFRYLDEFSALVFLNVIKDAEEKNKSLKVEII